MVMAQANSEHGWAEAYRIINGPDGKNVAGKRDAEAYAREAEDVTGRILEVGCGTGRIYLRLLQEGHDVYGIDVSQDYLDVLKRKADENGLKPHVLQEDMRSFSFDVTFELIIVPYDTVRYVTSPEGQLQCLSTIRDHLSDDGKVIFEFSRPESAWSTTPRTLRTEFTHEGDEYLQITTFTLSDPIEQLVAIDEKLYRNGTILGENSVELARIYKREFEHLLQRAGFDEWNVYSDFDGTPLGESEGSKSMVWEVPSPE